MNQENDYDLAADLDFVAWDNYLRLQWRMQAHADPAKAALNHDAMRGLKKQNFWVMEQQSGGRRLGTGGCPSETRRAAAMDVAIHRTRGRCDPLLPLADCPDWH
jgi:hypothetical protein